MPPIVPNLAPYVVLGRVVTMDAAHPVYDRGAVYVRGNSIDDVRDAAAPAPDGFENAPRIDTHGTIYPGLIELHNHLSYDALRLWAVPRQFANRDGWSKGPTYRGTISGPMHILGATDGLGEAVVRYVEAKCLLAGTTTSQGIALAGDPGIQHFYYGVVRNVEETKDPALPDAATRIADVDAREADRFLDRLQHATCLLLHLAEGRRSNASAHEHFEALHQADGTWAITPSLAGIHCVALTAPDFEVMATAGASMVWSPLSNLLLYGQTADVGAARASGIRMGIGSDWSPSGSKNLLFELKVARLVSAGLFSDRELLAMATTNAAQILGWPALGTLAAGQRADLLAVSGRGHEAHEHLFHCRETDVNLVVIDGVPRAGTHTLMDRFGLPAAATETVKVGSTHRVVFLAQAGVDPAIANLTLRAARTRLRRALRQLPELARRLESPAAAALPPPRIRLLLDHEESPGWSQRPHLPDPAGQPTGTLTPDLAAAALPLSQLVQPLPLDPLTVADDADFIDQLTVEPNLPGALKEGLQSTG